MNRLFLVAYIVFGISILSFGQFKGGIKAGMNVCDFIVTKSGEVDVDESFNTRVSYHLGSYVQDQFSEHFAWQAEVLFSNKGYTQEIEGQKNNISLNYLNLPILLIYKPVELLELEVGPEFGFMITGDELMNNFDFAIDIGARFNISPKFNAGMRYSYGLPFKMNVEENNTDDYISRYQNGVFQIYLGFNLVNKK